MKNKIKKKIEKIIKRAIPFLAVLCLISGMSIPVYGTEKQEKAEERKENAAAFRTNQAPKVVITDIYHRHIGSPDTFGGCYQNPIEHVHQGSAQTGGGCYTKPVRHTHQGSEQTGGGCYGKEIPHEHQGNAADGGGCFSVPIKHEHQDSCYEERECTVSYMTVNVLSTETGRCFSGHGDTAFVRAEGIGTHDSCDIGTENTIIRYCQQCGFMAPTMHDYQTVICGKNEETVEGYKTGCGKEQDEIERYEPDCGYEENATEYYEPECGKDADGYGLACGLREDVPCGRLTVTNENQDTAEKVTLSVKLEDLTGGKLEPYDNPYIWRDENGNQAGSGDKIQVEKNGNYSVTLRLKNKDVDESGLTSKILVDNIWKADPQPSASAGAAPSEHPKASERPAPAQSPAISEDSGHDPDPDNTPDNNPDPAPSGNGQTMPEINHENKQQEEDSGNKKSGNESAVPEKIRATPVGRNTKAQEQKADSNPSPSITPFPKIMKETKKAELPKRQAMEEIRYKTGQTERKDSIFANPVVRIITVTAGVLILIIGILLWLLYLRNSVKVYNDDGEGRMIYLGRCLVRLLEDAYTIKITEAMVEKAYTNRYCIKPGLFGLGREDEALVIYKDSKNATAYISKEMIIVL
ncbi:hypothetical protein D7V94_07085 [Parablautia intestinalis]|uniref:Uncharacterized protein n=1 Tax=Parablautia intestinalis TaxID=2320100 RepID=A0A3A9B163_9FIRM|nr:hypothetical protein [Parablautia intestinalis]RKI92425.1 hypothetical protein D7V94_07085 [Parablautia intestinalis]